MPVYDDQKQKLNSPGSHDDLGVDQKTRAAEISKLENQFNYNPGAKKSTPSTSDIKNAEETPDSSDQIGSGYNAASKTKLRGRFTSKQKLFGGGLTGGIIAIMFGLFSIVSGPLQVMHFGQLLQQFHFSNNEDFSSGRSGRLILNHFRHTPQNTRLSIVGNKFANKFQARMTAKTGLSPIYHGTTGTIQGYRITDPNKATSTLYDVGEGFEGSKINDTDLALLRDADGNFLDPDTYVVKTDGSNGNERRKIKKLTKQLSSKTGSNKIANWASSRLLIKRAGLDFRPIKNIKEKAVESYVKRRLRLKEERAERRREGVKDIDITNPEARGAELEDGTTAEPSNDTKNAADSGGKTVDDASKINIDAPDADVEIKKITSKINVAGRTAGAATAIVGIACAVRAVGDASENLQYANIILPMMRMGGEVISVSNQVMGAALLGEPLDLDELGSFSEDLYDEVEGTSWASARSIQFEQGQPLTGPDIDPGARPDTTTSKPAIFNIIDGLPGIGTACGIDSAIGNLPIIKQVGDFTNSIFTAVLPNNLEPENLINSLVSFLAGNTVDAFAAGAKLGSTANYGARLAATDQAIAMGGVPLSPEEVVILDENARLDREHEQSQRSVFAKVFDVYNPNSLASVSMRSTPKTLTQVASSFLNTPFKAFSLVGSFSGSVYAQADESTYYYGFNEAGFSQRHQDDTRFQDPYENAKIVESNLAQLNDAYGECFSMTINPVTGYLISGEAKKLNEIAEECKGENEDLLRYRFYIADMVTATSLACYEGDVSSCAQLGVNAGSPSSSNGVVSSQVVGDVLESSAEIPCDPRTNDLGIHEAWIQGTKTEARLCALPNIISVSSESVPNSTFYIDGANGNAIVNSRVSGAWFSIIEAAKNDDVILKAFSSFRTMAHQQQLWNNNPDSQLVARPGGSPHQNGLAIDFAGVSGKVKNANCTTTRAVDRDSPAWNWLNENAGNYGLKQYATETWHWDFFPKNNRCGNTI